MSKKRKLAKFRVGELVRLNTAGRTRWYEEKDRLYLIDECNGEEGILEYAITEATKNRRIVKDPYGMAWVDEDHLVSAEDILTISNTKKTRKESN